MIRACVFALYSLLVCVVLALCANGCGPRPYVAPRLHPTPEQISELARLERPPVTAPAASLEVTLMPRVILAGTAVWVTCYVPASSKARAVRYGLEGVRMSQQPIDGIQYRLLAERVPCGTWVATCALSTGERVEAPLEVMGGECDGGTVATFRQPLKGSDGPERASRVSQIPQKP